MTRPECFVDEQEVYLYLDNEINQNRKSVLDNHIKTCSNCNLMYEVSSSVKQAVQYSCRNVRAPMTLRQRIENDISQPAEAEAGFWYGLKKALVGRSYIPVGAAAFLVVMFLLVLLVKPVNSPSMLFIDRLISEHNEYLNGYLSKAGISSADPLEVTGWIAANTGAKINLPSAQIMPAIDGACYINYNGRKMPCIFFGKGKNRISLFLPSDNNSTPEGGSMTHVKAADVYSGTRHKRNYAIWKGNGLMWVLISDLPRESLMQLAGNLN